MTRYFHLLTLLILLVVILLASLSLYVIPHTDADGFGKMNAHQMFAYAGRIASLGIIDRTLVDWYMLGPTLEENVPHYNEFVFESVIILVPVFLFWCLVLSYCVRRIFPRVTHRP